MLPHAGLRRPPLLLMTALLFVACAGPGGAPGDTRGDARSASLSVDPTADPGEPSADAPTQDPGLDAEIQAAIAFRQEMGLRADVAWVQAVAANPDAVLDYGAPLLPFEVAQIEGRPGGEDPLVGAVQAYLAEHPDAAGGLYIDQARGGIVTMLVVGDAALHESALRAVVGQDAPLAVRSVAWTERQLEDLQTRLFQDRAFFDSLPAFVSSSATDVIENVVVLDISSAVPDAAERIVAHFGVPPAMLRVVSDGTGLLLQPSGRIIGRVLAPPGTDLSLLSPQYEADVPIGPRDAVGIVVAPDGSFTIDRLPPATYTVTILELRDAGNVIVGSARVSVPPGGAAFVKIPYAVP